MYANIWTLWVDVLRLDYRDREIDNLHRQIKLLRCGVEREEEKASDLETKAKWVYDDNTVSLIFVLFRMYFYGEYNAEDQDQMLEKLDKKVSSVYTKCIGANDANIP